MEITGLPQCAPVVGSSNWQRREDHVKTLLWMIEGDPTIRGGHQVQLAKTAEALATLGLEVSTSGDPDQSVSGFDIVHGFGLSPTFLRRVRQARIPVVQSTIYWGRDYRLGLLDATRGHRAVRLARLGVSLVRRGAVATAERMLEGSNDLAFKYEGSDLLLPNSRAEADAIRSELGVTTPCHVVPNGVDAKLFTLASHQPRDGVLYVGRIEPHKNQLRLIRALRGTGIRLSIVGPAHPHHEGYVDQCRAEAGPDVRFLGNVAHERLPALYQSARVHAMPSMFETTGLTSLEAALCGCGVVTTNRGYVREYFEALAYYCDPLSLDSIRAAVTAALEDPRPALRDRILNNFTWKHTALATRAAYFCALNGSSSE
jgi:glycosyltransferase involved in cell wall biosynthesis